MLGPYISASKLNNGITGFINKWTHEGPCFTIANSGSVGYVKFRDYKFCGTDSIYVLKLKKQFKRIFYSIPSSLSLIVRKIASEDF